jgi:ElaB/YqjD/DUF883 family membrane-anchored ribosome-binding protein
MSIPNDPVSLKDDLAKRVDTLGTLVKTHPFAALGVGFGIGYLLARLAHR